MIIKHILFFSLLFLSIQSLQIYLVFHIFDPKILVMPLIVGALAGYLVGYFRQETQKHINSLLLAQENLQSQVQAKTKELEAKNSTLEVMTLTDPLTGLGNRIQLKKTVAQVCEQLDKSYEKLSVLMIDIDYFKDYNDCYGHLKGDDVLQKIGQLLNQEIQKSNITAIRFGGEEFCLILPAASSQDAIEKAKTLNLKIKALQIPHQTSKISNVVTVSIGVHTITASQEDPDCTLLEVADQALYSAKAAGRNQVFYL